MDNGENKGMTFVQKLENYWYHYKWHTILGLFALCVIIVCATQCASKSEPDAMIMYAGNFKVVTESSETPLSGVMSEDYNGDGEKRVDVFQLIFAISEKNGEYDYVDPVSQTEEMQRIDIEFHSGSSVVYILHPFIYRQYKNLMCPLSEMLTEIPEGAVDEYGIKLSALRAYSDTALGVYPEDAILCVRNRRSEKNLISRPDDEVYYNNNLKFFKELIEY